MTPNERFCRAAGICWHGITTNLPGGTWLSCSCGTEVEVPGAIHFSHHNPDFTDAREVLKVMDTHPQGKLFYAQLMYSGQNVEAIDDDGLIERSLVTDRTGKLRDLATEWMEERK